MKTHGDAIAEALSEHALLSGLDRVAERRWASFATDHVRRIFEFEALKGGSYSARWGFSIDFVPKLKGVRLVSKRTAAAAEFDLCIDPIDVAGQVPDWCSFSKSSTSRRIARTARTAFETAVDDWREVGTRADLAQLFGRRSNMTFRRFSLANYSQTDLAWGLLLLSLGQIEQGEDHLRAFCTGFNLAPDTAALTKARKETLAIAGI